MQNLFWLFCPFSSLLTPNTHCMCPVIPKYLHFKNSHVLSWLCPWANCSFFLKWLSSHLDFLKKIFLGLTWLAFQDSLELFPRESNQKIFSEFPDLSYKPPVSSPKVPCAHLSEHPVHRRLFHRIGPQVCVSLSLSTAPRTLRVLVSLFFFDLFYSCVLSRSVMSCSLWPHGL